MGNPGEWWRRPLPAGWARRAGLRPGDVIVQINQAYVMSTDDTARILSRYSQDARIQVQYLRAGRPFST